MSTVKLPEILRHALREGAAPTLCIAFSGGPDSTALLHALAQLPEARERGLRALHVDHGLHVDSAGWAGRCVDFCETLGVPLTVVRTRVGDARGEGIEAAARRARYAAFAEHLAAGEWLALAHHRDDQVETVLLKLLRGAGPEGLGGMRELRPLGRGFLWRPLLETPREMLRRYMADQGICAIDDPANSDPRFARNIVRHEVMPLLTRHWPRAEKSILHAARLCRVAADHLGREAETCLIALRREDDAIDAHGWLALPDALRAPALDAWLHAQGLPAPPDDSRAELERQAACAGADRVPLLAWPGAEVRIWNGRLHAMPPLAPTPEYWEATWSGTPLALPEGCGRLTLEMAGRGSASARPARFDPPLTVRLRSGGERIKPSGDDHTRELRDLFQQARIPPWLRLRCPLVFENAELIAVADLWISERGKTLFDALDVRPEWVRPARLNET